METTKTSKELLNTIEVAKQEAIKSIQSLLEFIPVLDLITTLSTLEKKALTNDAEKRLEQDAQTLTPQLKVSHFDLDENGDTAITDEIPTPEELEAIHKNMALK
jgi:hypothetical protein